MDSQVLNEVLDSEVDVVREDLLLLEILGEGVEQVVPIQGLAD